jgi:hypothetical protein
MIIMKYIELETEFSLVRTVRLGEIVLPYIGVGSEGHGAPSFRLWVSKRLLADGRKSISFPLLNATIVKTEGGHLVLVPSETHRVLKVIVPTRSSKIISVQPASAEVYRFKVYQSPCGSLGVWAGALIVVPLGETVRVEWERLIKKFRWPAIARGFSIIYPDNTMHEEVLPDED